jgi:capsid assembly protease
MQNNLTHISNRLVTGKWLMSPVEYQCFVNLIDNRLVSESGCINKLATALMGLFPKQSNDMAIDEAPIATEGKQYAAVIPVCGVLMKDVSEEDERDYGVCNVDRIGQALDDVVLNDDSVSKVILDFKSPGGEVTGIEILARKIEALSKIKPIIGWTSTHAASGAWWLMSQCTEIGLTPDASIGSCGVYVMFENYSKALEQAGIEVKAISAGKFKMLGHGYKDMTKEEESIVQADVDNTYIKFKSAVTSKRNIKDEDLQGLMYEGEKAVSTGYADFISDSLEGYLTTKETNDMKSFKKIEVGATNKVATIVESAIAAKAQEPVKAEEPAKEEPAKDEPKAEEPADEMKSAKMNDDQTVACPHCSKAFALDMGDEAKEEEPAKEEPKAEEPKKEEPKAQAAQVSSEPITMGSIFGLTPEKKQNVLQTACDHAVKSVLGI